MEQCPIKEMEINFQCVIDTENSLFEPVPAKKIKPEWYKKLPAYLDKNDGEGKIDTIKKCPAMHDWLSMGYLIRNRHTILIVMTEDNQGHVSLALPLKETKPEEFSYIKELIEENDTDKLVEYVNVNNLVLNELSDKPSKLGGHPGQQVTGMSREDKMAFKFKIDFLIETPKGTSCYYLDPFLFDNPYFTTWQGVIDTDKFNQLTTNNMIICYPKVDKSFIITKGTPLVQIVPFVRYPWKSKITYLSKQELSEKYNKETIGDLKDFHARDNSNISDIEPDAPFYARKFKTRKEYS